MTKLVNPFDLAKKSVKQISGVYFLFKGEQLLYIGQSTDVEARIQAHKQDKVFDSYSFIKVPKIRLLATEAMYIKEFNPKLNVVHRNMRPDVPEDLTGPEFAYWSDKLKDNSCDIFDRYFVAKVNGKLILSTFIRTISKRGSYSFRFKDLKGEVYSDGSAIPRRGWFRQGQRTVYFDTQKKTLEM